MTLNHERNERCVGSLWDLMRFFTHPGDLWPELIVDCGPCGGHCWVPDLTWLDPSQSFRAIKLGYINMVIHHCWLVENPVLVVNMLILVDLPTQKQIATGKTSKTEDLGTLDILSHILNFKINYHIYIYIFNMIHTCVSSHWGPMEKAGRLRGMVTASAEVSLVEDEEFLLSPPAQTWPGWPRWPRWPRGVVNGPLGKSNGGRMLDDSPRSTV